MIKVKDKVIVRSNNEEDLIIGTVSYFENLHGKNVAVVKDDKTNKHLLCMSIVIPYSDDILNTLKTMNNKEQWDFLAKDYQRDYQ
jgi:hypothetical protein